MHHIAQSPYGTGNNRNLLHRLCILLQGADQRMAYLMVGNDPAFFLTEYPVLFLLTYKNHLNCFKQILLTYCIPTVFHSQNRCLVNHIRQIGAHSSGGRQSNGIQIHSLVQGNILCMYLQNIYTTL